MKGLEKQGVSWHGIQSYKLILELYVHELSGIYSWVLHNNDRQRGTVLNTPTVFFASV